MKTKFISRIGLLCALALPISLTVGLSSLSAQSATPTTSIAFSVADGTTLYRSTNPAQPVRILVSDPGGIKTAILSSSAGTGTANLNGVTSATLGTTFYAGYYPIGSYPFTATVTNMKGVKTKKAITLQLLP